MEEQKQLNTWKHYNFYCLLTSAVDESISQFEFPGQQRTKNKNQTYRNLECKLLSRIDWKLIFCFAEMNTNDRFGTHNPVAPIHLAKQIRRIIHYTISQFLKGLMFTPKILMQIWLVLHHIVLESWIIN